MKTYYISDDESDNGSDYDPSMESDTGSDVEESLVDSESDSECETVLDDNEIVVLSSDDEDEEYQEYERGPRLTSRQYGKKYRPFLTSMYPDWSKKEINDRLGVEYRKYDGNGQGITNRNSTLRYEISKALIDKTEQFTDFPQWILDIQNKHYCVYCNTGTSKNKGDHIFPVIKRNSRPTLTNMSNMKLPCCSGCNSARGNKECIEFCKSNPKYGKNAELLEAVVKYCTNPVRFVRYRYSEKDITFVYDLVDTCLDLIRLHVPEVY